MKFNNYIFILFKNQFWDKRVFIFVSHLGKVIERLRELVRFKVRVCFAFEGNVFDLSVDELSFVDASSLIVTRFLSTLLAFVDVDKFPTPAAALLRSESDKDLNGWCEVCWTLVAIIDQELLLRISGFHDIHNIIMSS